MEDLRAYAEEKGQTVTMAMERILRAFLDEEAEGKLNTKSRNYERLKNDKS